MKIQHLLATGILSLLLVTGSSYADPLTPLEVSKLQSAGSVQMAPSGRIGFFTVSRPRLIDAKKYEDGGAHSDLYVVEAQGAPRLFLQGEHGGSHVHFTQDESALTFLAKRPGDDHTGLYRISLVGGEAQKIYSWSEDILDYVLSPDGRTVYFVAKKPLPKGREKLAKRGFKAEVYEEDWRYQGLYSDRISSGIVQEGSPTSIKIEGHCSGLQMSQDGKKLGFLLAPNPGVDADIMFRRIQILDLASKQITDLKNPGKLGPWSICPDGKHVAAISGEDLNDPDAGRILVKSLDGSGGWKDLWPGMPAKAQRLNWLSSDKLRVLVLQNLGSQVWEIGLDGQRHQETHIGASEVVDDLSSSRDGEANLYVAESGSHPAKAYWSSSSGGARELLSLNPGLKSKSLALQEPFSYKARDGQEIFGTLIHPLNEQPGQKYPLIVFVHGGPESLVLNGWLTGYSMPGQIAAARGFAVFYPNYRGSVGRGVAFSKISQGDPAGKEFDDIVDGVDALIAKGLVDKSKVGITGGSYGGYATAWCSTYYSDRFAAGVMSVGISDKISKSGTTDIPEEEFLVHARRHPWDDWNFFLDRSPIKHTGKSKTPLLILHGKEDPRVHPSQSLELYRYLKMNGKAPVRLVLYPGEGHGNRKAAARYDFNLRMLEWMEFYLKGNGGTPPNYEVEYGLPND